MENCIWIKIVAVYPIIRNNESLYELACVERDNKYNIVLYNILSNKKTNKIYNAHSSNVINNIKHYYSSVSKKHFLLSSNNQEVKLWNITSKIFTNELEFPISNNDGYNFNCLCLLFKSDDYFILTSGYEKKK